MNLENGASADGESFKEKLARRKEQKKKLLNGGTIVGESFKEKLLRRKEERLQQKKIDLEEKKFTN